MSCQDKILGSTQFLRIPSLGSLPVQPFWLEHVLRKLQNALHTKFAEYFDHSEKNF